MEDTFQKKPCKKDLKCMEKKGLPPYPSTLKKKNGPIVPLDQNPHQTVTRDCAPNATILLVYIPAKIKMSFI